MVTLIYILWVFTIPKKQKIQCGGNLTTLASETEKMRYIKTGKISEMNEKFPDPEYLLVVLQNCAVGFSSHRDIPATEAQAVQDSEM